MFFYTCDGVKSAEYENRDTLDQALREAGLSRGQGYYITEIKGTPSWVSREFQCKECGEEFPQLCSPGEDLHVSCPQCGQLGATLQISAPTLMNVAIADGVKRNESMQLTVRGMQLKSDAYKLPVAQRAEHAKEISAITSKAKEALQKGK